MSSGLNAALLILRSEKTIWDLAIEERDRAENQATSGMSGEQHCSLIASCKGSSRKSTEAKQNYEQNLWKFPLEVWGRVVWGYSHIWAIRGCAPQQGMVFAYLSLEQGLQISVSVWNRVYFCLRTLEHGRGSFFLCQNRAANEHCCCSPSFPIWRSTASHIFQSGTGYLFSQFCLEQGSKLCLFSLEQGQVPRHSAAHPYPQLRGVPPWGWVGEDLGLGRGVGISKEVNMDIFNLVLRLETAMHSQVENLSKIKVRSWQNLANPKQDSANMS